MQAHYYNALNTVYRGNYKKLQKAWERFHDWEKAFSNEEQSINIADEYAKLEQDNIHTILNTDASYPALLKEITYPPFGLYVRGTMSPYETAIGIVGTRNASPQSKAIARTFARVLANAGITIVSGLALGIDTEAHRGALEANGNTIAVLGTPPHYLYPRQNETLARDIIKNGAVISEFPLNHPYNPSNFLIRNRIISGLSHGVLIIEAPEKSGSLATARFAIEQNRDVFVVPGNIMNTNFRGSHALLKEGAMLVTDPQEIIEHYHITPSNTAAKNTPSSNIVIKTLQHNNAPMTIEKLSLDTKLPVRELNKELALMVIQGILKESHGKYFIA